MNHISFHLFGPRDARLMEGKVSNAETVQAIYEAFGRGDLQTVLDKIDDVVEWETTVPVSDVPWLQARRGKANIGTVL